MSDESTLAPPSHSASVLTIVLVGGAAGLLSGMFGVGGGILLVPGLVLIAKMVWNSRASDAWAVDVQDH